MESAQTTSDVGGAPLGNTNAVKHGARSKRVIPLSALGKPYTAVGQSTYCLRKRLEAEVTRVHGQISMGHEDLISAACRWEVVAQVAYRQISKGRSLTPVDDAKSAAQATMQRSAAIKKLDLTDDKPRSEWDVVDEMREAEEMAEEDDTTQEGDE